MSFFKNLGAELGSGAGKGIVALVSGVWAVFCGFLGWLFKWEHKQGESAPHTNSLRIAVGSFILALFFVPGLATCSFSPSTTSGDSEKSSHIVVFRANLDKGHNRLMPPREFFIAVTPAGEDTVSFEEIEGIKYYLYNTNVVGGYPIRIDETSCLVVPASKRLLVKTDRPPLTAYNMEEVSYYRRLDLASPLNKAKTYLFDRKNYDKGRYFRTTSWEELYEKWDSVIYDHGILVEALPQDKVPDQKVLGGLVCF